MGELTRLNPAASSSYIANRSIYTKQYTLDLQKNLYHNNHKTMTYLLLITQPIEDKLILLLQ